PTPTPTPTPTPESARLIILKQLDIDPSEAETLVPDAGWSFVVGGDADELGVTGADGFTPVFTFDDIDGSLSVDVAESVQPLFALVRASCEVTAAGENQQIAPEAIGDLRGTLDLAGAAVNAVRINAGETVTCTFVNESGEEEEATGTPRVTPPPTSMLPVTGTPGGDSWRIALLAIAALLAMVLLLTPATPAKARRRR
ncbi:MAG: hypothetical protein ABIG85_05995, partial [Chloroflexota bacterium]